MVEVEVVDVVAREASVTLGDGGFCKVAAVAVFAVPAMDVINGGEYDDFPEEGGSDLAMSFVSTLPMRRPTLLPSLEVELLDDRADAEEP